MNATVRRIVIGAAAAALLAGCLGRSPRPEFYRLEATAVGGAPLARLPDLGLAVGPLEFPRYLERPGIVTRDGDLRVAPSAVQRWGGTLRNEVERVVADDLAALLGTSRVAVYPVQARFPVAWRVLVDVRAFEGVRGESVTLRARWVVASGATGEARAVEETRVTRETAGDSWDAYVAAQSEALGVLTRQITERIAALSAP